MLGVTIAAGLDRGSLSRLAPPAGTKGAVASASVFSGFRGVEAGQEVVFLGVLAGDGGTLAAASSLAASWRLFPAAIAARAT